MLLSCTTERQVRVDLLSQQYDFDGGMLQSELALPADIAKGFTVSMELDMSAPDGVVLDASGSLRVEKTAEALEASLALQQYYDSTEFRTQTLSVPFRFVPCREGVHNLTVQFTGAMFEVYLDGRLIDNDASLGYPVGGGAWEVSDAVRDIRLYAPARTPVRVASCEEDTAKYSAHNIQYWTPDFYNGWVGDVVSCYHDGRYHLFYLFDRRHHGGKFGHGGHWFEHLSTADFKTWTEHETALPLTEQWMTYGTGTAFTWKDSLLITYGYHTSRFHYFEETTFPVIKDNADEKGLCEPLAWSACPDLFPEGGTYAVSADGIEPFVPSGILFHYSENPSVFPDPDSEGLKMYANYLAHGTWVADDIDGPWTCTDPYFPPGGDCTFPFAMGDWEYVVGGFHNMWYRSRLDGEAFKDMIPDAIDLYNGINVPTITILPDGRCIMAGWTNNGGWAGNLVIYEVVQHPDGSLGTRWMDEITPALGKKRHIAELTNVELDREESCMLSFDADADEEMFVRFASYDRPGEAVEWYLEPDKSRATYVLYNTAEPRPGALLISEGGRPEWMKNYAVRVDVSDGTVSVRMMIHNEAKMTGTLIDTEICRDRTMLDHHQGFKFDSATFSSNIRNLTVQTVRY